MTSMTHKCRNYAGEQETHFKTDILGLSLLLCKYRFLSWMTSHKNARWLSVRSKMHSVFLPGPSLLNTKVPIRWNMTSTWLLGISNKYQKCAGMGDTLWHEIGPTEPCDMSFTFFKDNDEWGTETLCWQLSSSLFRHRNNRMEQQG